MKDSQITFRKFLNHVAQFRFPDQLISEITNWSEIHKSPYGLSFYNAKVDWDFKPHDSLRVSDHWNFETRDGMMHCQTTNPVPNNTHWAIGKYDANIKKYVILHIFTSPKHVTKNSFHYQYFNLLSQFTLVVKKYFDRRKDIELSFMNKYYKLLEDNLVNPDTLPYFCINN